jgi:hypothetical protein
MVAGVSIRNTTTTPLATYTDCTFSGCVTPASWLTPEECVDVAQALMVMSMIVFNKGKKATLVRALAMWSSSILPLCGYSFRDLA